MEVDWAAGTFYGGVVEELVLVEEFEVVEVHLLQGVGGQGFEELVD